jgi:hypothetical protein
MNSARRALPRAERSLRHLFPASDFEGAYGMNMETLFSAASMVVLPGWLLLVFLPGWRWTTAFVTSLLLPAVLALMYLGLMVAYFNSAPGGFSAFNSLAGVKGLFQIDGLLLAGWIHYLAFDLFIGSWEVRDARRLGVPHLLVVPCLLGTFMLGPIGLLAYLALRFAVCRQWTIDEGAAHAQPAA